MARTEPLAKNGLLLFWGQWPSNWHASPFTVHSDGGVEKFTCVEQYMMVEKARLFGDWGSAAKIMATPDPAEQKRLGKRVTPYIEAEWAAVRYGVVLKATIAKYKQNADLKAKLLASVGRFVEAAPDDRIWGIGLKADDPRAWDPKQWRGTNLLGQALDEARAVLLLEAEGPC